MYGPVLAMSRNVGVLNAPLSSSFLLTLNRPRSGFGLSIPMPMFVYLPLVKLTPSWQLSQRALLEKKTFMPRCWDSFSAVLSPASNLSYGELPESTVRSKVAIALAMWSMVIGLGPNTFSKRFL